MPPCIEFTHHFGRCKRNAVVEGRCRSHHVLYEARVEESGPRPADTCPIYENEQWCGKQCEPGLDLCHEHEERRQRFEREDMILRTIDDFVDYGYTWQGVLQELYDRNPYNEITQRYIVEQVYYRLNSRIDGWIIDLEWNRVRRPDNLSSDPQNVHRTVISEQTNKITDILLTEVIPPVQDTECCIAEAWYTLPEPYRPPFFDYWSISKDIQVWYTTSACRTENDWLYKKILDGLIAYIEYQPKERRTELYIRLYQEASESMNMCCEGHIARLCNVVVGFIDGVEQPVSVGEILQMKMAAIAQKDISVEAKRAEAEEVLRDYSIEGDLRDGWLEAF